MSNLTRKVRRNKEKQTKKAATQTMKRQLALFKCLPDRCSTCELQFDKTSRDHHLTWQVKVYEETEHVGLSCPSCQEKMRGIDA